MVPISLRLVHLRFLRSSVPKQIRETCAAYHHKHRVFDLFSLTPAVFAKMGGRANAKWGKHIVSIAIDSINEARDLVDIIIFITRFSKTLQKVLSRIRSASERPKLIFMPKLLGQFSVQFFNTFRRRHC